MQGFTQLSQRMPQYAETVNTCLYRCQGMMINVLKHRVNLALLCVLVLILLVDVVDSVHVPSLLLHLPLGR